MLIDLLCVGIGFIAGALAVMVLQVIQEGHVPRRAFVSEAECDTCQSMLLSPGVEPCASCDDECSNWIPRREGTR